MGVEASCFINFTNSQRQGGWEGRLDSVPEAGNAVPAAFIQA